MSAERLAIDGGTPVRTEPFTKRKPFGARELELLKEALESQTLFAPESDMVRRFEAAVSELYGVKYAIGTTSGTRLYTWRVALGLNPGDEVITAPITDIGTVIPILLKQRARLCGYGSGSPPWIGGRAGRLHNGRAIIIVHLTATPWNQPFLEIARGTVSS